ncbi:TVP38/TMEM64 family protein [Bacillus sp. PS06]|uniref:TVP38/TMEM64 family protein n=1 Tax=Bacillus sp. PS06 TaxID=2764176 RepID=UPI00177DDE8A|nr:VTT domain-containing protein [Bacillus sp. PS06]MBD8070836.1 VTT domain-containing protein [Bacillus sp. PS06]
MQESVIEFLLLYEQVAIAISICINLLISIFGVIPSFFLTAANLIVFGFWEGMLVSFIGESLGAGLSFWIYRKGLKRVVVQKIERYKWVSKLLKLRGKDAFGTIMMLRLLPFVPSGVITFAAAMGEVSGMIFFMASSIGKIPALVIEAYSVYHVTKWTTEGKFILTVIACFGLILMIVSRKKSRQTF